MTRCGGAQVRYTRAECTLLEMPCAGADRGWRWESYERHGDVMVGRHAFRVWPLELDMQLWPDLRRPSAFRTAFSR